MCIPTNNGCTLALKEVRHVPYLHLNLIFVHALDLADYHNDFGDSKWKLSKGSMVVARGLVIQDSSQANQRVECSQG